MAAEALYIDASGDAGGVRVTMRGTWHKTAARGGTGLLEALGLLLR